MVAIQNIVFTIAAGATMVRGSNNVRARDAALNAAFKGCSEALDHGAKPSVAHNHDGSVSFIHYPAVCETEANTYKPTNGMTITISGNIITVKNAPADFLAALDAPGFLGRAARILCD
ncbi:hypothetical protein OIDMADRAFT_30764 [Oidiodendron maius Zn]|uniref:Uncharacterized protein n=1 Tax=Oidiodendron maius (strain Zn) TaxID=913774 RepID=A0A0C3H7C6_OIDMZ|nr:hypothetical protein OIDMADRAFT_30764 [Oidiodendron maius Zn]